MPLMGLPGVLGKDPAHHFLAGGSLHASHWPPWAPRVGILHTIFWLEGVCMPLIGLPGLLGRDPAHHFLARGILQSACLSLATLGSKGRDPAHHFLVGGSLHASHWPP